MRISEIAEAENGNVEAALEDVQRPMRRTSEASRNARITDPEKALAVSH
jgi:hypothetical protein